MITYNFGTNSNYLRKTNRSKAGLPILHRSMKRVRVANGRTNSDKYVTKLPFQQLSPRAAWADTFKEFPKHL